MAGKSGLKLREVNLELGKPSLDQAMKRLAMEVTHSRSMQCAVLKIIHGYGSSGTGGKDPHGLPPLSFRPEEEGGDPGCDPRRVLLHL